MGLNALLKKSKKDKTEAVNNQASSPALTPVHSAGRRAKIGMLLVGVLLGIFVAANVLVVGIGLDRLALVRKNPAQNVVLQTNICNDELIAKYNDAADKLDVAQLKTVSEAVSAVAGNASDPTCVYMNLSYALQAQDAASARKYFDQLSSLNSQGLRISEKISRPMGLSQLEVFLRGVEEYQRLGGPRIGEG